MNCGECADLYVEEKLALLEGIIRRMTNVMHCSENSKDVTDVQKFTVSEFRAFEDRWNDYACPHGEPDEGGAEVIPPKRKRGRPPKSAQVE